MKELSAVAAQTQHVESKENRPRCQEVCCEAKPRPLSPTVLVMTGNKISPEEGKWVARLHGLWSRSDSESEIALDGEVLRKPEQPPGGLGTSTKQVACTSFP